MSVSRLEVAINMLCKGVERTALVVTGSITVVSGMVAVVLLVTGDQERAAQYGLLFLTGLGTFCIVVAYLASHRYMHNRLKH
jgi:hypothetical protein